MCILMKTRSSRIWGQKLYHWNWIEHVGFVCAHNNVNASGLEIKVCSKRKSWMVGWKTVELSNGSKPKSAMSETEFIFTFGTCICFNLYFVLKTAVNTKR